MAKNIYDYVIIGSGISGANIAYQLNKYSDNILIIEKEKEIAYGASGAAGGFLSPLLGKPNKFKDLVNEAFNYSTNFYKKNMPNLINQCGTLRIPKDNIDRIKFKEYIPFIESSYKLIQDACYFPEASIVKSAAICKALIANTPIQFNTQINAIRYDNNIWYLDDKYETKNLILTTGASEKLIDEFYINIRAIWGQRIDIETSSKTNYNYHKECSISVSKSINEKTNSLSIGATHHRNVIDKEVVNNDTKFLLNKANDILELKDVKVIKEYVGARAASVDYFPIVGKIINSSKTLAEFPYLKKGTNVNEDRFTTYTNLYMLNGVGGRGFVLAPYLAKELVNLIVNNIKVKDEININRLFKREVKRLK